MCRCDRWAKVDPRGHSRIMCWTVAPFGSDTHFGPTRKTKVVATRETFSLQHSQTPCTRICGSFRRGGQQKNKEMKGRKKEGPRWKGSKGRTYDPRSGSANVIGSTVLKMWLPRGLLADYVPDSFSAMAVLLALENLKAKYYKFHSTSTTLLQIFHLSHYAIYLQA